VALATGLGQLVFTAFFGFVLGLAFSMPPLKAFNVAVALTFSSTIIIVKLLSDKREIDSLHGRVALGFLIVQDIVVVLAMIVLSAFGVGRAAEDPLRAVVLVVGASGLVSLFVLLFLRLRAYPLTERLAHNPELLLFAVALAAPGAAVADVLGFGKELRVAPGRRDARFDLDDHRVAFASDPERFQSLPLASARRVIPWLSRPPASPAGSPWSLATSRRRPSCPPAGRWSRPAPAAPSAARRPGGRARAG
jgi:hypothetical protein